MDDKRKGLAAELCLDSVGELKHSPKRLSRKKGRGRKKKRRKGNEGERDGLDGKIGKGKELGGNKQREDALPLET